MSDKLLPIGSVVTIKLKKHISVVILGYSPEINGKTYDYSASILPVGLIVNESIIAFNSNQIGEILFKGYKDDSFVFFANLLEQLKQRKESDFNERFKD